MISQDRVLELVQQQGPIVPTKIAKQTNQSILFASAILSELSSRKKVRLSHLKIGGGSPLYYVEGQEEKLIDFIENLDEKDQNTVELLKEKKIIRDNTSDPLTRVSLRNIKDFAIPLEVSLGGESEIFWKWYMLPDEEAGNYIRSILEPKQEPKIEEIAPEAPQVEEIKPEPAQVETKEEVKSAAPKVEEKKEEVVKKVIEQSKQSLDAHPSQKTRIDKPKPTPKVQQAPPKVVVPAAKPETQATLQASEDYSDDEFYQQLMQYFGNNNIEISSVACVKKKNEYDFTVSVESSIGKLNYFCKAKNRKRMSDGDLSSIFLTAQNTKLPVLVLTTGVLTKKAEQMLQQELKGMTVRQI